MAHSTASTASPRRPWSTPRWPSSRTSWRGLRRPSRRAGNCSTNTCRGREYLLFMCHLCSCMHFQARHGSHSRFSRCEERVMQRECSAKMHTDAASVGCDDDRSEDSGDEGKTKKKSKLWKLKCHPISSFVSLNLAEQAINTTARAEGYCVVTLRSKENASKEKMFVELACDRHGKPRAYKPKPGVKRRKMRKTRKCNCPMRIYLVKDLAKGVWNIQYRGLEMTHNHQGSLSASSHPAHRRSDLTPEVLAVIETDYRLGIKPAITIKRLLLSNSEIAVTVDDVYNARRKIENEILKGKSQIEYLLDQSRRNEQKVLDLEGRRDPPGSELPPPIPQLPDVLART